MKPSAPLRLQFQSLNKTHNRAAFACRDAPELELYLRERARKEAEKNVAAVFILPDLDGETVIGYYTLSSCCIQAASLPDEDAKKLPRYPELPATLIGRLAVSDAHRGRNYGASLMYDALHRSWLASKQVASIAVVVDARDDLARSFYLQYGFQPLTSHPRRLLLPMHQVAAVFQ